MSKSRTHAPLLTYRLPVSAQVDKPVQIELVPRYPACTNDAECQKIDASFRCEADDFRLNKRCKEKAGGLPLLKLPLTSKGRVSKRTFFIRNRGTSPLKVDSVVLEAGGSRDFKLVTSGLQMPFTVAPGAERELTIEYAPSDDKEDTGRLVVTSNATGTKQAFMRLVAASRGCNLSVQPLRLDFPGPVSKQVTIFNKGNEVCLLKRVFFKSGKAVPFTMQPTPKKNQIVVPNGGVSFLVKFDPPNKGPWKDIIVVDSDDPDEPIIEVEVTGEVKGTRECAIEISPAPVSFGLVSVGRHKELFVSVRNAGFGDCELKSLNIIGTNPAGNRAFAFVNKPRTPLKVAAGSNIRFAVVYTPPAERSGWEGKLEVVSNDTKAPNVSASLTGSSGVLCLEVIPTLLDFGATKFGCSSISRFVEIFHLGSSKCPTTISITGLNVTSTNSKEFLLKSAPTLPRRMSKGQSTRVELRYKAKDLGVDTASLEIANDVAGQSPIPVRLVGEGLSLSSQRDVFKQATQPQLDLLFVIDDSSSIGDDQKNLSSNASALSHWLVRLNVDYRVMVTTTDVTGRGGGAGCARGKVKIVTPQTPNPDQAIAANMLVGTRGSASEKGLEAAYRALISPATTGCNRGFYRPKAALAVIFVSDEEDQSPQSVSFYVSFLQGLKGPLNLHLLRASAIVGEPPSGCRAPGVGSASAAPRYWDVVGQLRGVRDSICNPSWANTLSNVGTISIGQRLQYFLSRQADPKTIKVKINGKLIPEDNQNGWVFDPSNNSVSLTKSQTPPTGATIEVEYLAICLP